VILRSSRAGRPSLAADAAGAGAFRPACPQESQKIYDELQTKQASLLPSFRERIDRAAGLFVAQRKTIHHRTAAEILDELLEWLEIYARASEQDRPT